jgi:pimeloyl-ACP methyl ester carboxylesterase
MTRIAPEEIAHNLHYSRTGQGPDVLLVHGWASSSQMWNGTTAALTEYARFWAVDLAGFGDSPGWDGGELNVEQHARMLLAFCDHHNLRPHMIAGHSMGGMIALKMALLYPEIADKLVLVCPVVTGRFHPISLRRLLTSRWGHYAVTRSQGLWKLIQQPALIRLITRPWQVNERVARQIEEDFQRTRWWAGVNSLESMATENLAPYLRQIRQPTLVIVGRNDRTVPPSEGRLAAQRIPNARLEDIPRCRHQVPDENPERFRALLRGFLHTGGGGIPAAVIQTHSQAKL